MNRLCSLAAAVALLGPSTQALAQLTPDRYLAASSQAPDLVMPTEPSALNLFSSPRMALYRPEGAGPFPAVVLHHQCGGLRDGKNLPMLNWAKEAVSRGYVALVLDSLSSRSVDTVCFGAKGGVNFARGLKDALLAAEHLKKLSFVDPTRIGFSGYSWGGGVGLLASSQTAAAALNMALPFSAVVAFYPPCHIVPPNGTPAYDLVVATIHTPLLVLMGERDTETPPRECVALLAPQKNAGAPIEWHIYPEDGHCWDCDNLDGYRKVVRGGVAVQYRYSRQATRDSADRVFDFLGKHALPK